MLYMKRVLFVLCVLIGCVGCGSLRKAQKASGDSEGSIASVYAPQDTVKTSSAQLDSSKVATKRVDSTLNSSKDSTLRDSTAVSTQKDSTSQTVTQDSVEIVQDTLEPIRYAFSPVYQTDVYVPAPQEIPAGEYSGITYIGENRYAVVHDKLNGGGIVFFDLAISNNGKVLSSSSSIPSSTSNSKISGRDNEGIAFVPKTAVNGSDGKDNGTNGETVGTLFVSSESSQSIVEYTLDGKETGRKLAVPSAFAKNKITPNNGFEALTYNDATKIFWTTTETPLKADGTDSRLLRLQSFNSSLKASNQYLYKMDAPVKSASEGSAAKAYVHGVPALVALDDGSLIVLEREVYVPNGGLFAKALGSFSRTLLYVVTPGASSKVSASKTPQVLEKKLLISFSTSALNLANFEGMCQGPELPGGWHTLILIADSQGGSNGLTAEYIKVLAFK